MTTARDPERLQRHVHLQLTRVLSQYPSLKELAEDAGVPYSTLWAQYSRQRYSLDVLWQIAPVVNRTVAWFIGEDPEGERRSVIAEVRRTLEEMERR